MQESLWLCWCCQEEIAPSLPSSPSDSSSLKAGLLCNLPHPCRSPGGRSPSLLPSASTGLVLHITTASPTKPAWLVSAPLPLHGWPWRKSCLDACCANGRQMLPLNFSALLVYPTGTEPCWTLWCSFQQGWLFVTVPGSSDLADSQFQATEGKNISPGKQVCRGGLVPPAVAVTWRGGNGFSSHRSKQTSC